MTIHRLQIREDACTCSICEQYPQYPAQEPISVKARDPSGQEVMVVLKGRTAERFRSFMEELKQSNGK